VRSEEVKSEEVKSEEVRSDYSLLPEGSEENYSN